MIYVPLRHVTNLPQTGRRTLIYFNIKSSPKLGEVLKAEGSVFLFSFFTSVPQDDIFR